jgi:glycolate oxidase FAD binding subunit
MLPFEPPQFQSSGTIGGAVAAGLAGPGSPWRGGVRDSVLGIEMINGLGERLLFGGQVIKNVAGFDVSRLLTGANGSLGVLLKISLKLIPIPEAQPTVMMKFQSVEQLREMMSKAYPITATLVSGDTLWLRLSGERSAVDWAIGKLGAQEVSELGLWQKVRDLEHNFFKQPGHLWRLILPVMTEIDERKNWLIERGAGLRWLKSDEAAQDIFEYAHHSGGAAIGFSKGVAGQASAQPEVYQLMLARVRQAFDPHGIFHDLNSEALLQLESGK